MPTAARPVPSMVMPGHRSPSMSPAIAVLSAAKAGGFPASAIVPRRRGWMENDARSRHAIRGLDRLTQGPLPAVGETGQRERRGANLAHDRHTEEHKEHQTEQIGKSTWRRLF